MTQKAVPASASGAAGYSVFYGYDMADAQIYARFGSTSGAGVTNSYDGFGRLTSSSTNVGGTARALSYLYDAGSRRTRLTYPDGNYFLYEHDPAGRLTAIRDVAGVAVATFGYNNIGRPTAQSVSGTSTSYGYDSLFRLSSMGHDLAGTAADQSLTFAYNPASQIVTRTASNDAYAYAGHVNVSRSYAVNGLNQYTTAGPASFLYDANGNLRSDGSVNMVYDAENRLVSASGAKTAALSYDPMGRLAQTSGGAPGVTQFLYDGDELVAEYNGSGTLLRRYVHGLGSDDPILWYEGAGLADRRSLQANHQGSIVGVANDSGTSTVINAYDEWGVPNAINQGRLQYTGQAWLPELGMYHYKARIYSPTLGRFLQTDPIGYDDQVNLYAYVGNDPVNNGDPTGMCTGSLIQNKDGTCKGAGNVNPGLAGAGTSNGVVPGQSQGRTQTAQQQTTLSQQILNNGSGRIEGDWITDVVVFGGLSAVLAGAGALVISVAESSVPTVARVLLSPAVTTGVSNAAAQVVAKSGTNSALRGAWGVGEGGARDALRAGVGRPSGVSNEVLRAYETTLKYQIQAGRDRWSVAPVRLRLIREWLKQ